jgi:hypothetical protein
LRKVQSKVAQDRQEVEEHKQKIQVNRYAQTDIAVPSPDITGGEQLTCRWTEVRLLSGTGLLVLHGQPDLRK